MLPPDNISWGSESAQRCHFMWVPLQSANGEESKAQTQAYSSSLRFIACRDWWWGWTKGCWKERDGCKSGWSQPAWGLRPQRKKKKNCFHVHLVNFDWLHFTGSHLALFSTHFPIPLHWGEWEHGRNTLDHSLRSKTAWEPFFSSLTEWGNYFHLACSEFTRQSVIASVAVILQAEQPPPGQSLQQERE